VLGSHVGLRAGEAQGLFVSDIDFLRCTLNVRRQLDGRSEAMVLCDPKTSASARSIPVPRSVLDVLGHSSPSTTLKTYASLWPGDEDRIRSAIASSWQNADQLRTG